MSHEIREIPEFCCHSKDNGKIKKKSENIKSTFANLDPDRVVLSIKIDDGTRHLWNDHIWRYWTVVGHP